MSLALGEVDLDLETNAVFGNLAKDSAKAFAAALTGQDPAAVEPERPPKAAKLELGKRGRPLDSSHFGGRNNGQGNKGQGKGGKGGKISPSGDLSGQGHGQASDSPRDPASDPQTRTLPGWSICSQGPMGPSRYSSKRQRDTRSRPKSSSWRRRVRAVLLSTLFLTLLHCLQALSTDANQQKSARDKGWMTQGTNGAIRRWDAENQVLQIDEDKTPIPHQELIGLISKLAELKRVAMWYTDSMRRTRSRRTRRVSRHSCWRLVFEPEAWRTPEMAWSGSPIWQPCRS